MAKLDTRLELRLDRQTYERLERRAAACHVSVAQVVRDAISRELVDEASLWREQALEKGLALRIPMPEDPQDLARELAAHYDGPGQAGHSASSGAPGLPGPGRHEE